MRGRSADGSDGHAAMLQLSECIERMREAAARDGNMQHDALVKVTKHAALVAVCIPRVFFFVFVFTFAPHATTQRYREIHFDYNSEFKTTTTSIQRKRETAELFASSRYWASCVTVLSVFLDAANRMRAFGCRTGRDAEDDDSDMARLLRERSSLAASMRSIQDVVG
jgi:hypothetical protein